MGLTDPSAPSAAPAIQKRKKKDTFLSTRTLQRTYTGLLDDVMIRYGTDFIGEEFFNKTIAKNIFFGGGLYLNDGYLVNHPSARKYLYDEDSLLRLMLSNGFIFILTRERDPEALTRMPETMAGRGNRSYQELVASSEWDSFQPVLEQVATQAFNRQNWRGWPRYDMSYGYRKLIAGIFESRPADTGLTLITEDQLKYIHEAYWRMKPEDGNARDKFERAAQEVVGTGSPRYRETMAQIMEVGCQAYHYNFGLTLNAEEEAAVAVDTTLGPAFDELLHTESIERGQLEDIPLIQVPKDLPFDRGELFLPFIRDDTAIARAKLHYLSSLRALLSENAQGINDLRKAVREATDHYFRRMHEYFGARIGASAADVLLDGSVTFANGLLPAGEGAPIATAAPTAGLAITLHAVASNRSRQFLIDRFRLKDVSDDFRAQDHEVVRLGELKPQIAALAFDEAKAEDFVSTLPTLKPAEAGA